MWFAIKLAFKSLDEILWCLHSIETSSADLLHNTIYSYLYLFLEIFTLVTFRSEKFRMATRSGISVVMR